jgi:PhnB protein
MTSRLNPYLAFNGNAREAMEFYQAALGGELIVNTFGDFGTPGPDLADKVMHSQLETESGLTLMGADSAPDTEYRPGSTISVSLTGDSNDGLREAWEKLTVGGNVTVPLEKQMWGDEFGQFVDRFGTPWMINITQPQD